LNSRKTREKSNKPLNLMTSNESGESIILSGALIAFQWRSKIGGGIALDLGVSSAIPLCFSPDAIFLSSSIYSPFPSFQLTIPRSLAEHRPLLESRRFTYTFRESRICGETIFPRWRPWLNTRATMTRKSGFDYRFPTLL